MSLGTHLVERALTEWVLSGPDVAQLVSIRRYLRPEDYADPGYAAVYAAALAALDAYPGSAGASGALAPQALQERVVSSEEFLRTLTEEPLPALPRLNPRAAAPRDWARRIVEDAARRRLTALADRVAGALQAADPVAELEMVRVQIGALMSQLESARMPPTALSRIGGSGHGWRDLLPPLDRAGPTPQDFIPGPAEVRRIAARALALLLQEDLLGPQMLRAGEIRAADLSNDPLYAAILSAAADMAREGQVLDVPLLFRTVEQQAFPPAAGARGAEPIDMAEVQRELEVAAWRQLPAVAEVRHDIHEFVARTRVQATADTMRAAALDSRKTAVAVVVEARSSLHSARAAVDRLLSDPAAPARPVPAPVRRSGNGPPPIYGR